MSYVKKTWTAGQKVKSADLNNMEGGIDAAANPFIVTLTPDAQDLSGSMDKTPEEITAAYVAGREIRIAVPALGGITGICTEFAPQENGNIMLWCNFVASLPDLGGWVLITIITSSSNSIYSATVFPLTPLS